MTIIVFLVDTSASMNQRTYLGTTLLDVSKGAVETFMKIRARDPSCRWDRYMLLTFDEQPGNVKAGWKESHATFMRELKNLEAVGLTTLSTALKQTFDLLNVNRMQSGIDTYGQGRCPFYLEPAIIIFLTDGRKMTTVSCATNDLNLLMTNAVPGSELTKEPFRWDQRLFSIVLRIPATTPQDHLSYIPSADDTAVDAMCEVTGGRSYSINSQRTLTQCLESLVQKCQSGVVVHFEKIANESLPQENENEYGAQARPASPTLSGYSWQNCRRLIYVPRSAQKGYTVGHWPIPESFWPDLNSPSLPPRTAHPILRFSCQPTEPVTMDNLPYDKYELEPSPLTQYLLEKRQPNVAWQVFVASSARYNDLGHPFGYLKASSTQTSVNLFVMPYNYPQLVALLDELFKVHKLKPTLKWKQQFDIYLRTMPLYYTMPLKRALLRMGAPNIISDQIENCLSYTVVAYLKKLKNQAKIEYDKMVSSVGQAFPLCQGIRVVPRTRMSILQRTDFHQMLAHNSTAFSNLKFELSDYESFSLQVPNTSTAKNFQISNPYNIPRSDVLKRICQMRDTFMKYSHLGTQLKVGESNHNVSVQDMGNYQEFLKKQPAALRVIETMPMRQHTFGNPFKVNKNLMIDEADEAMPGQSSGRKRAISESSVNRSSKKKRGPLPRDVSARELVSPTADLITTAAAAAAAAAESSSPHFFTPINGSSLDSRSNVESSETGAAGMSDSVSVLEESSVYSDSPAHSDYNSDLIEEQLVVTSDETINSSTPSVNSYQNEMDYVKHNQSITRLAMKEIRKPGKNHRNLFDLINDLHGSVMLRGEFVLKMIAEAGRFKRRTLISLLQSFLESQRRSNSVSTTLTLSFLESGVVQ